MRTLRSINISPHIPEVILPGTIRWPTKDGGLLKCVTTKSKDMRVVSSDECQCVLLAGKLTDILNGIVEYDNLSQCQVIFSLILALVNIIPWHEASDEGDP